MQNVLCSCPHVQSVNSMYESVLFNNLLFNFFDVSNVTCDAVSFILSRGMYFSAIYLKFTRYQQQKYLEFQTLIIIKLN